MCYIHLRDSMESWLAKSTHEMMFNDTVLATEDDARTESTSSKRKASEDLESERAKRSKAADDAEQGLAPSTARTASTAPSALQALVDEQGAELKKLKTELDESEKRQHSLTARLYQRDAKISRLELLDLQRDEAQHQELTTATKKLEDMNKEKWSARLQSQKDHYEGRLADAHAQFKVKIAAKHKMYQGKVDELKAQHEEAVQAKQEAYQKKIEDLKERHADALAAKDEATEKKMNMNREKCRKIASDAKTLVAQKTEENKAVKDEFAKLTSKAKADLKEALAKAKPEQSDAVREKAAILKNQSAELKKLQLDLKSSKEHVNGCERAIGSLQADKKSMQAIVDQHLIVNAALEGDATAKGIELDSTRKAHLEEKKRLLAHVDKVEKRWQVQYDAAHNTEIRLKDQQRANFDLRIMTSDRDRRIGTMSTELESIRAELTFLKAGLGLTRVIKGGDGESGKAKDGTSGSG